MKWPDEDQRLREERNAERDRGREARSRGAARRTLAGRDAVRIKLADRGAALDDEPQHDLDMRPRDVDAGNRWQAYTKGWRVGARGGVSDPKATGHADRGIAEAYQAGYEAGHRAFNEAAQFASESYGYAPSPLRKEPRHEDGCDR